MIHAKVDVAIEVKVVENAIRGIAVEMPAVHIPTAGNTYRGVGDREVGGCGGMLTWVVGCAIQDNGSRPRAIRGGRNVLVLQHGLDLL